MQKASFVCWHCHTSYRSAITGPKRKCAECGRVLNWISPKAEIPKKSDVKAWNALREDLDRRRVQQEVNKRERKQRLIASYEAQIAKLESKPENKDRQRLVRDLQKELLKLQDLE